MIIVGFAVAIGAGLFGGAWWWALIATAITLVGANIASGGRLERSGVSNPLMLAWLSIPLFALWWVGSLIHGLL